MDLRHPKRPVVRDLGDAEFFPLRHDSSAPSKQTDLGATIRNIRQEITDNDTGSRFILASDGLWIIRHPATEKEFELRELQYYAD